VKKTGFNTMPAVLLAGVAVLAKSPHLWGTTHLQHGRAITALVVIAFAAQVVMWVAGYVVRARRRPPAGRQPGRQPVQPVRGSWQ
jgi:hypothetical protein